MKLSIVFLITSFLTLIFIIVKIRKNGLNIDDSIVWIVWSFMLLILSLFPEISTFISNKLGFMSTSNFIFSVFIFFLYILLFVQAIQISKLKAKHQELVQKISIMIYNENHKDV